MSTEQPAPGRYVEGRWPVEGEHLPARPRWQCGRCGRPWPCEPAKNALLAEYEDSPFGLSLYMSACLHTAIDDLRTLNAADTGGCADAFDRFLGWTRRRASGQRTTTTEFPPLPPVADF